MLCYREFLVTKRREWQDAGLEDYPLTRAREREIRAWLIRHFDDADPPRVATWLIAELLNALVELRTSA